MKSPRRILAGAAGLLLLGLLGSTNVGCGHDRAAVTPADVASLGTLDDVMEAQEHAAEPHFSKLDRTTFSSEEFASLTRLGELLQATSAKTLEYSRGPAFDELAKRLGTNAKALATAATASDAAGVSRALGEAKATCDACHSQFH